MNADRIEGLSDGDLLQRLGAAYRGRGRKGGAGNGKAAAPAPPSANGPDGNGLKPADATVSPLPPAEAPEGRDKSGRFTKGNPGGPGNPFARKVGALRSALLDAVSADDVRQLARKLLALALGGDLDAARLLLLYAVGRPAESVNPDRLDLDELELVLASPRSEEIVGLVGKLEAAAAVAVGKAALGVGGESLKRRVAGRAGGGDDIGE